MPARGGPSASRPFREREGAGAVLQAIRLVKRYGERNAVHGVSFRVHPGEVYGLLGPNGAGKTTTLGLIASVVSPDEGEVRIGGVDPKRSPKEAKRKIGLVPQTLGLYPTLTAEENLAFFGRLYGIEGRSLLERVSRLLELAGLENRRRDRVETFSGGMQRRLNLVCGLVHEPDLLLLDEPTVGVDPQSRERIFSAVEELAGSGMAILYTTHYMEEAERLCHRVGIQDEGELVAEGTVSELAATVCEGKTLVLAFESPPPQRLRAALLERGARVVDPARFQLSGDAVEERLPSILRLTAAEGGTLRELSFQRPTLGDVFLHLTGKALRD